MLETASVAEPPMNHRSLSRLGLMLGFVALLGSVPALANASSVTCPPVVKHHVVAHVHHWVHRYIRRTVYTQVWLPACGSIDRPCDVEHLTVEIQ
jgi:hypothetical protein